jgi:large subunit ribosomal protein L4
MAENTTTNFDAAAYTARGTARERVSLPAGTFDGTVNMPVMHQAVKAYLANQRQGNASTKTRGIVTGGNRKPWKQKGTGRARQGSTRAPNWVGGGTVFGPQPRAYDQYVPRQVRALAKKSALNTRAREHAIFVIDAFAYDAPRSSAVRALVGRLGVADQKVLILTDGVKENVYLSARNFPNVHVMPYSDASTYHILWSDVVLVEAGAIGQTLAPVAESEPEPAERPARRAASAPAAKKAPAGGAPRRGAAKAARKSATKAAAKGAGKSATKAAAKKPAAKKSARKRGKE